MKKSLFTCIAATAALTGHAGAQTIHDHRSNPGGSFNVRVPWPGEFAIRNAISTQYVSINGSSVASSATAGANARFRIVETAAAGEWNVIGPNNAELALIPNGTPGGPITGALGVATSSTSPSDKTFHIKMTWGTGFGDYNGMYLLTPKDHDTWAIQQGKAGPFAFSNMTENAQQFHTFMKCGDIGSGLLYKVVIAGSRKPAFGVSGGIMKLIREADGTYVIENWVTGALQPKRMIVAGGGGYASNTGAPGGYNVSWEKPTDHEAWQKVRLHDQGDCTYTIQTSKNWIMGVNKDGHWSTRLDNPAAASGIGYSAVFELWPQFINHQ